MSMPARISRRQVPGARRRSRARPAVLGLAVAAMLVFVLFPVYWIVVNSLKASPQDVANRLQADAIETERSAYVAESLLLGRGLAGRTNGDGLWWPQSESSAMPVETRSSLTSWQ